MSGYALHPQAFIDIDAITAMVVRAFVPTGVGFTIKPLIMTTIQRIRLGDLAAQLGCELHGDPRIEITGVAGVEQAGPGDVTFLANPKYAPKAKNTRAAAILVKERLPEGSAPASLVSANPYHDFARTLGMF